MGAVLMDGSTMRTRFVVSTFFTANVLEWEQKTASSPGPPLKHSLECGGGIGDQFVSIGR